MDPITLGIGAGLTALNGITGFFSQRDQNASNKELARYTHELNMDAWREQMEYNNPTNTMQRLTDAGINPRAYQQLGQFANASSPAQAQVPTYSSPLSKFTDVIPTVTTLTQMDNQSRLVDAQVSNLMAQSGLAMSKMFNEDYKYLTTSEKHALWRFMNGATIDEKTGDLKFGSGLKAYNSDKAELTKSVLQLDVELKRLMKAKTKEETEAIKKRIELTATQIGLNSRDLADIFDSAGGGAFIRVLNTVLGKLLSNK